MALDERCGGFDGAGEKGPELDAVVVAAAMMHPNLPGCDQSESKVCDVCYDAAGDMVDRVLPGVLKSMGLDL